MNGLTSVDQQPIILRAQSISKSYSGVAVLSEVDLSVRRGEVHAVLGENGAGKSTLMKILTGSARPDAGTMEFAGSPLVLRHPSQIRSVGIGIVYQEFNLLPHLTVAENILIADQPRSRIPGFVNVRERNARAHAILSRLNVDIDPTALVMTLTVAQQQMVEIAKALSYECRLLILDEPTAALTESEVEALFRAISELKSRGVSFIYISHRMNELAAIADRVSVLRDGRIVAEHDVGSVSTDELIAETVGREIGDQYPRRPRTASSDVVLDVGEVSTKAGVTDVSFELRKGEILGVAGLMGAGRTELARALIGVDRLTSGRVAVNDTSYFPSSPQKAIKRGIGYVTENRKEEGIFASLSVQENVLMASYSVEARGGWISAVRGRRIVNKYIERLSIRVRNASQEMATLSGGNQQKAILARWLSLGLSILILDEPTRGIDAGAKFEIYQLMNSLVENGVSIIMISSELPEVLGMSDRILVMAEGRVTATLDARTTDQEAIAHYAMAE